MNDLARFDGWKFFESNDIFVVGREDVRDFARTVRADNAAHWFEGDDNATLLTPPTFASKMGTRAMRWLAAGELARYGMSGTIHTDQTFTYYHPMRAGDEIRSIIALLPIRTKAGGDIIIFDGYLVNQHGTVAAASRSTVLGRAGNPNDDEIMAAANAVLGDRALLHDSGGFHTIDIPAAVAELPETPTGDDPAIRDHAAAIALGDPLPTWTPRVALVDLIDFAGVSGDLNPIHYSDYIAHKVGLKSTIAHGMLTMGLGASYLTNELVHPLALVDYKVRFTGIAPVSAQEPAAITYSGRVKSVDEEAKTAVLAITATVDDKRIFGRATATVAIT
ncbi:FAS1-like dehydratase domain-containing protein [Williamsia sterculiae]|uniref:Acyl dehydratase n=1 Tax=Williamsia sterculiae TaxID=1344003 RepID=A0A1N7FHF7_9NOCA|nr:MaoC family dehydratase N-terminal domain-containing protein [Williamsia sterculiae]SIR99665.1 Acyl dehydratase [Williamsia sterculiae]